MPPKNSIDISSGEVLFKPLVPVEECNPEDEKWADDKPWPIENPHSLTVLNEAFGALHMTVERMINIVRQMVTALSDYVYKRYPNRRVVHLAINGKRARTRKKNRNRIIRDLKLEMKRKKGTKSDE